MKGTWPGVLVLLVLGLIGLGLLLGGSPSAITPEPDIHAIIQSSLDSPDRTDKRMATWETPPPAPVVDASAIRACRALARAEEEARLKVETEFSVGVFVESGFQAARDSKNVPVREAFIAIKRAHIREDWDPFNKATRAAHDACRAAGL